MKKNLIIIFCLFTFISCLSQNEYRRVVVVGGGLAGLSAAIEAYRHGATVLLLDKEQDIGGNSKKASSGMNAVSTPPQIKEKVNDTISSFMSDTIKSGSGYSNEKLVDVLARESNAAWKFLSDLGVNLDVVSKTGGHSMARTHRAEQKDKKFVTNIGMDIIGALSQFIKSCEPKITIVNNANVSKIMHDASGVVKGVVYVKGNYSYEVVTDAVILATGGYCGRTDKKSLLAKCRPDLITLGTTNGNCASGDGIRLAAELGAELVDMEKVQIHPTGFIHPHNPNELRKFLAPESLRAVGGILLNHEGKRFTNELGKRDTVTNDILRCCSPYCAYGEQGPIAAYLILNEAGAQLFQKSVLDFYIRRGFVQQVANAHVLAQYIGASSSMVNETFMKYNEAQKIGHDEFEKQTFPITFSLNEPLYVMIITPCLHYTMGGVKFDECARVLGGSSPIKNLYAAGEVTGGLHGANRLCGNSLLECVVFGRIAGKNAAKS